MKRSSALGRACHKRTVLTLLFLMVTLGACALPKESGGTTSPPT